MTTDVSLSEWLSWLFARADVHLLSAGALRNYGLVAFVLAVTVPATFFQDRRDVTLKVDVIGSESPDNRCG